MAVRGGDEQGKTRDRAPGYARESRVLGRGGDGWQRPGPPSAVANSRGRDSARAGGGPPVARTHLAYPTTGRDQICAPTTRYYEYRAVTPFMDGLQIIIG